MSICYAPGCKNNRGNDRDFCDYHANVLHVAMDRKLREIAKLHDERQQSEFGGNLFRRALSRFVAGEKL